MSHSAPLIKPRDGFLDGYQKAIGDAFVTSKDHADELTVTVTRAGLVEAARIARDDFGYQQLMEIAGADYPERAERFEVNYHFLSVTHNHRFRLKVLTDEDTSVPSLTGLWPVAGWLEREVFDLYGVNFAGNPDMRRILTDYGFEGHPLRKDFPMTGYVELRYSEEEKRVVYEPVDLPQDFRTFDFLMPWEGPDYQLPGDEKAVVDEPKTTESTKDTGAGKPTNKAAEKEARDSVASKAAHAGGETTDKDEPQPGEASE
ncbi:NADH-quinone oxidoreductase subunit C [Sphingomicrobium flavum]|uniref:NADH-quinone oxidoreductase subunit C n=1 Tax=Sphingomicrobium flavum TaxID=1229164 RepID=UPI0021AE0A99|nr:NADH-quinone oxidoreductase subunit C [Sphingomicrobium flavum]